MTKYMLTVGSSFTHQRFPVILGQTILVRKVNIFTCSRCLSRHPRFIEVKYTQKTIEGYLDSVPSLTFILIKMKPIMHAFHISGYLQSN